jgi:predicted ribosome-associated RNA-binding protein Tma20
MVTMLNFMFLLYKKHLLNVNYSSQNHVQMVLQEGVPLFINVRDGPFMPTLKLLHKG